MKQVVQNIRSGETAVRELPDPMVQAHSVLVANVASLVSVGTERYVVELARQSLVAKARQRPADVKRVIQKIREEGLRSTVAQVRARLDEPMPLGYSSAGIVLAVGDGVSRFKPGDGVAAVAPHASVALVGENLCSGIPHGVSFEQAAYTAVAAIALEGVRLANTSLGARIAVIGLGLIGQLAALLLKANGVTVVGTDLDPRRLDEARQLGLRAVASADLRSHCLGITGGHGVDAVLIAASTASNGPIELAADLCRHKGRVVLVGVAGLDVPRAPFFEKELEFTVSHSLGAGRSDRSYAEKGVDYPIGYARWTAQRNMETVLEAIANGALPVEKLTSHRFPIARAADAYDLIMSDSFLRGVVIEYDPALAASPTRHLEVTSRPRRPDSLGVSLIGAGNFARLVLLPHLERSRNVTLRGVCSAKGLTAEHTARKAEFAFATTDAEEVLRDPATSAVFVLTRHNLHADFVVRALRAGKHVFVEKPLCITASELQAIDECVRDLGADCPLLTVGFNRRFAPATARLREHFRGQSALSVSYRFAVPELPVDMWVHDPAVGGGRIVGEACHAIDVCVALTGSLPVRVFAESCGSFDGTGSVDDRVFITIRHANGSVSSISYQAGGDRSGPTERIEVFGGGRTAIVDDWDDVELWAAGRKTIARGRKDRGHEAELRAFVSASTAGGVWPIQWSELYATTWASLMAVKSLREGRAIAFDESAAPADQDSLVLA